MRPLTMQDKCYKFFFKEPKREKGSNSIKYEAHKTYSGKGKLFFFRKDEAVHSLKNLLDWMSHGDALAEIIVDQSLIDNVIEASPEHFCINSLKVGNVYEWDSAEVLDLIIESLRKCFDFSNGKFQDVLVELLKAKCFDSAYKVYETICIERDIIASDLNISIVMEQGAVPWRNCISLKYVRECNDFKEYIDYMKLNV